MTYLVNHVAHRSRSLDGRWGLVGGRDPALGTRTAQAWKFITGKPVTPPLGAYGMAYSIVVSPDGARALASTDNKTFLQWLATDIG